MTLASPLSLLLREAERGTRASEVLLLSYTLDLGFFERVALGPAQALGARVTTIGDAGMAVPDPRAVRRAGRTYVNGLASCRSAFHPKLMVIVGDERAVVAIGSGNVTMAGWSDNAELWTVLTNGADTSPSALSSVADWLERLGDHVRVDPISATALVRVAKRLAQVTANGREGPALASSLDQPIIDQLPSGPVDTLNVFSPFHDPGCVALRAVCDRLQPHRLRVAVQPELTVANPEELARVVGELGGEIVITDADQYRHGKLFEWTNGDATVALTGSANCSTAALMRSIDDGGNCELGLIGEVATTLMPDGELTASGPLHVLLGRPRRVERPRVLLLGAARVEQGVLLTFARPTSRSGYVEVSAPAVDPDAWERIGEFNAGVTQVTLLFPVEGGSRLRAQLEEVDGEAPAVSNTVFVVDPERAQRIPGAFGAARKQAEPFDLFRDWKLAERFAADLEALRASRIELSGEGGAARPRSEAPQHAARKVLTWQEYLDGCAGRLGYSLLQFALGLPNFTSGSSDLEPSGSWDEEIPDDELGLDDDTPDDAIAVDQSTPTIPSLTDRGDYLRKRYRDFATHLSERATSLGPAERLLAVRLVVWVIAADAWQPSSLEWVPVLARATQALGADPPPPEEVEPNTASLAAVALAVLRLSAPRTHDTLEGGYFRQTAHAVAHLLAGSDERYVAHYAQYLDKRFGHALHPDEVIDLSTELVQDDPLDQAIRGLTAHDLEAVLLGNLINVTTPVSNPEATALTAIGLAERADVVAASAGDADDWALIMWRRPDVVVGRKQPERPNVAWSHYRLSEIAGPQTYAQTSRHLPSDRRRWSSFPGVPLNSIVDELRLAVGLAGPSDVRPW